MPVSTRLCTPSLNMADPPVKARAMNFVTATARFPRGAAYRATEPIAVPCYHCRSRISWMGGMFALRWVRQSTAALLEGAVDCFERGAKRAGGTEDRFHSSGSPFDAAMTVSHACPNPSTEGVRQHGHGEQIEQVEQVEQVRPR